MVMIEVKTVVVVLKIILLLITIPILQYAQQPKNNNELTLKFDTNLVVIDAQVLRKKGGKVIGGLKKEDFILSEDGVLQEITHFHHDNLFLSIMLLLDISGSVSSGTNEVQAAGAQVLSRLKDEDQVALMVFNSAAWLVQNFTNDRELILKHLRYGADGKIDVTPEPGWSADTPMDGTRIADSIFQAANHFRNTSGSAGRRAIIVITDNYVDARAARYSHTDVTNELLESGAIVYGVIVDSSSLLKIDKYTIGLFNRNGRNVSSYANETGGKVLDGKNHKVAERLSEILEMLRYRYSLGYSPTNSHLDGKFRKIKLRVTPEAETRHNGVVIMAKQGYHARPRTSHKPISREQ